MSITIASLGAREILDSRGNPTIEVTALLSDGTCGRAGVPSGASTGSHEALELRDEDSARYGGKGVRNAVRHVTEFIAPAIMDMDATDQKALDEKLIALDGTPNKSRLGANAILGVSMAVMRAAAKAYKMPLFFRIQEQFGFTRPDASHLPTPMFNVINGGLHADSGLSIQEFKIIPHGIDRAFEKVRAGSEIFHALQELLRVRGLSIGVGDEGGFAPRLSSTIEAFDLLIAAIEKSGYVPHKQVSIGLDVAASSFYDAATKTYVLEPEGKTFNAMELVDLYHTWRQSYPILSIEDGLAEDDWDGWAMMQKRLGNDVILIGDDLLVTNVVRLKTAIEKNACNAALIKVNQIGTVSETIACMKLAQRHDMACAVSHRSGETLDDFISDLAVGAQAQFLKAGAPSRGERTAKYNRLMEIEAILMGV